MPRRRLHSCRRVGAVLCAVAALAAGCRVDVAVDVRVADDGSAAVAVAVTADAEVLAAAPDLVADLRVDDLEAAGWTVRSPASTADGGLQVLLEREVAGVDELDALLGSLTGEGGPLHEIAVARSTTGSSVRFTVSGTASADGGLAAFADPDLLAAIGATPYADELDERRLTPTDALGMTLRIGLPGVIERTGGTVADDGTVTWHIPLDGSAVDLDTASVATVGRGGPWSTAAALLRALFAGWIALMVAAVVLRSVRRRRSRNPVTPAS